MARDIERKLLRWGNGFGIRLTGKEVHELGLAEGEPVHVTVHSANPINDVASLGIFRFKNPYDIDKILDEELG